MHVTRLFAAATAVVALVGCTTAETFERDVRVDPDMGWDEPYMQQSNLSGRIVGDMPEVGAFSDDGGYGYAYQDAYYFQMDLHVKGDYGWAMVGVYAMIDDNGEVVMEDGNVIGCTGPGEYEANFDEPAEQADVQIETFELDGVEMQRVTVDATWRGGATASAVAEFPAGQ
ncbi:MAG: hypothetical protein H6734_27375 [Alphaproteobacteria bacterium]|nr:hypothetical protein [Alphaproteobacteria bacterium]